LKNWKKLEPINCRALLEPLSCRSGKLMVQVTPQQTVNSSAAAGHTGQSSQLFPVANARNPRFLAAVAKALQSGKSM
jgi:hypothetical protein